MSAAKKPWGVLKIERWAKRYGATVHFIRREAWVWIVVAENGAVFTHNLEGVRKFLQDRRDVRRR